MVRRLSWTLRRPSCTYYRYSIFRMLSSLAKYSRLVWHQYASSLTTDAHAVSLPNPEVRDTIPRHGRVPVVKLVHGNPIVTRDGTTRVATLHNVPLVAVGRLAGVRRSRRRRLARLLLCGGRPG